MLKMLISPVNYNQAKNIQHNKTVTQVCYKYMSAVVTKCLSNGDLSVGVTVALSSNRLFPSPSRATPWGTILGFDKKPLHSNPLDKCVISNLTLGL